MRIAYVCADPGIPIHGHKGASVHVTEVVRAFRRAGHDVELLATRVGGPAPADLADVLVHRLDPVGRGEHAVREQRALAANAGLVRRLDDAGPFDVVYERYSLMSHGSATHAQRRRVPLVVEVNAPLVDEQALHRTLVDRAGAERATRRLFGAATSVVAVSEPVAAWAAARAPDPRRVHVVPNGVDPGRFARCRDARSASDERPPTIGFVGSLKPWHGVHALVEATARVAQRHDVALRVVGDGPRFTSLEEQVRRVGLSTATTFVGAVDPVNIPAELARMDVGTAPYASGRDDYFSPLKVFEYQAAGLPVVASAVGQVGTLVEHGRSGLLCTPGDVDGLADALEELVTNPRRRAALGAAGYRSVHDHHTWDAVVDRVLATIPAGAGDVGGTLPGTSHRGT